MVARPWSAWSRGDFTALRSASLASVYPHAFDDSVAPLGCAMTMPKQKPGRSKQDYATPRCLVQAVKHLLNIDAFTHDFAADQWNSKAGPFFWNQKLDALSMPAVEWAGKCDDGWGWLNPPYANIGPWALRCLETSFVGGSIAFLVPASVGSNWFRDYVDGHARVLFANGRVPFMPDKPKWLYPKDVVLCLYGPQVTPGYEVWQWR